jgi:putative two-component system response regulator
LRTHATIAVPLKNNAGEVLGVFQVANKSDGTPFDKSDEGLLKLLGTLAAGSIEIAKLYQEVRVAQLETIYRLAVTAEYRDQQDTRAHLKNISIISYLLALAMGLSKKEADLIKNASPLHDIGKVGIPDEILRKPARLNEEEWAVMSTHAQKGYDVLVNATHELKDHPLVKICADIILNHHERFDGAGYPNKLKGDDIPVGARLMSVADVYDALVSKRPYKEAYPHEVAVKEILEGRGTQFDPDVVDAFMSLESKLPEIYEHYKESS